jgi:hypothetical protein
MVAGSTSAAAGQGSKGRGAKRRSRQARRRSIAPCPRFGLAGLPMRLTTRADRNKEVGEAAREVGREGGRKAQACQSGGMIRECWPACHRIIVQAVTFGIPKARDDSSGPLLHPSLPCYTMPGLEKGAGNGSQR